jgi:hypothetical protein
MEPFVVVSASDDKVQVPFVIPMKDGETLSFSIPRLNFIDEAAARQMKKNILDLDRLVPQIDPSTGDPIYEKDNDGEFILDGDGHRVVVMGPPQMSVHERLRSVSEAMLGPVVPPAIYRKLQKLTVGELDQIIGHWTTISTTATINGVDPVDTVDPGESSASSTS